MSELAPIISSGLLSNPSIKIMLMGQSTANYKLACAEMSYDLCEVGSTEQSLTQNIARCFQVRNVKVLIIENAGKIKKSLKTKMPIISSLPPSSKS